MVHSCYGQRQKRNGAKFQWRQFKNNYDTVTGGGGGGEEGRQVARCC